MELLIRMTPKTAGAQSKEQIASAVLMTPSLALRIFAPRSSAGPRVLGSPPRCVGLWAGFLLLADPAEEGGGAGGPSPLLRTQWPCSCFICQGDVPMG